ncbi:MAG TPA: alpha/beta hydrolase, partial [Alphaproteobacteria bacterium]|nr:alpha/beta hydrolase [Alphaproteobacteria bacterium]
MGAPGSRSEVAVKRWLKKIAIALVVVLVGGTAVGYVLQERRDARILADNPPPGRFVDVGGHELHYRLFGEGPVTFVLEAGGGEYGATWEEIEEELARLGGVFVYDRAGLGWSEEGPHPRTIERIVEELHAALDGADVPPPYVLVGHSLGGAVATFYAMKHPERVAGLLLVDPSHQDQVREMPQPP